MLKPKQKLDILQDNMVNRGIPVLEHDNLIFSGTTNNEPFLEVFRFNQEEFISNDELSWKLGHKYTLPCSQITYEANIRIPKQRILERRQNIEIVENTVKAKPSIIKEPIACIRIRFCIYKTSL